MRALLLAPILAPVLGLAPASLAQDAPPESPASVRPAVTARPAEVVRVERLDGTTALVGADELALESLDGAVLLGFDGDAGDGALSEAIVDERAELWLVGGGRVLGQVIDGEGDLLELALLGDTRLRVVIDRIESLRFPGRVDRGTLVGLEPAAQGDRLYWIRPGGLDRVDGTVEAFEGDGVRFDSVLGSKLFPWEEIAALHVEPFFEPGGEAAAPRTDGARPVQVELADGGRLTGTLTGLSAAGAVLEVEGAGTLELPLQALAEIVSDDGSAVFLSSLPPAEAVEGSPFGDDLGMRWPHRRDRSVTGGPLLANGVRHAHGLGVHAPSRLVWKLDGRFAALRGAVAIDDSVLLLPHRGSVVFRVLLDGEAAWESPLVRGGGEPLSFDLDLDGARELALEVDMATRFHEADRANWLGMLLVR